jgi:hypothetical protein
MNKEEILKNKIDAYNAEASDIRKFALNREEIEMFASAMQDYADQSQDKFKLALQDIIGTLFFNGPVHLTPELIYDALNKYDITVAHNETVRLIGLA